MDLPKFLCKSTFVLAFCVRTQYSCLHGSHGSTWMQLHQSPTRQMKGHANRAFESDKRAYYSSLARGYLPPFTFWPFSKWPVHWGTAELNPHTQLLVEQQNKPHKKAKGTLLFALLVTEKYQKHYVNLKIQTKYWSSNMCLYLQFA